jgi:hypothetical protein
MLEGGLRKSINSKLPRIIHRQSMTNASLSCNGTPDDYYDGPARDFWIEWKMLKSLPRSGIVVGDYSPLQLHWMERRYRNSNHLPHGPNMLGIVGLPNRKAVIQRTPTEWREGSPLTEAISLGEVTAWVTNFGLHLVAR